MKIIRGKIAGAKKVVVYGPEGIGKSTFASQFPDPLFIDTEGSTKALDVARTETPSSWAMLMSLVKEVLAAPGLCGTLVIDTADWAEMLCTSQICSQNHKNSIEEFGYGKGYVYLQEEFGRLLNLLEDVVKAGIHVVLTAHAKMRKFEQPDEMGAYDRWEMKLSKGVAPMVKEWADMVLFANYKTQVVNVDGQGAQKGKNKAQGGKRVLYTSHHPCWDAKNRYGLPAEVPLEFTAIAQIMTEGSPETPPAPQGSQRPQEPPAQVEEQAENTPIPPEPPELPPFMTQETMQEEPAPPEKPVRQKTPEKEAGKASLPESFRALPEHIPKPLRDLMAANGVDEWDIQNVVGARGYYTADTPIQNYDPDFIDGVLVGAWEQVLATIKEMKKNESIPFN